MTLTLTPPSSLACRPRWSTPRTDRPTLGGKVAEVAERLGTPFMPWQRHVADVALEINPDTGRLVYRRVGLLVPRQSGKTTELLAVMVHRALAFGEQQRQRITYTAQNRNDARKKWEDEHLVILDRTPYKRLYRTRKTNGFEAILWKNGSIHDLMATTEKSGHGPTLDLGVVDEAFAQTDHRLEQAMSPAMITRPQAQMWVVSTAGTPTSALLWSTVETGRGLCDAGVTSGVCYFEWSAPEEADPGDPATWYGCMPALGLTVEEDVIRAEFQSMQLAEFKRAYLNQWTTTKSEPVIPLEKWAACLDQQSRALDPVCFSFDVTPDRARSSIAACGSRDDGLAHVEALADDCRPGTDWVPARLLELRDAHHPRVIVCDPKGPAGSLLADLEALGIKVEKDKKGNPKQGSLLLVDGTQHAQACGMLFDRTMDATLRHRDQPLLVAALDGAKQRPLGDAWAWSRKASSVDISPLVAVTLAHWAHCQVVVDPNSIYEERDLVAL